MKRLLVLAAVSLSIILALVFIASEVFFSPMTLVGKGYFGLPGNTTNDNRTVSFSFAEPGISFVNFHAEHQVDTASFDLYGESKDLVITLGEEETLSIPGYLKDGIAVYETTLEEASQKFSLEYDVPKDSTIIDARIILKAIKEIKRISSQGQGTITVQIPKPDRIVRAELIPGEPGNEQPAQDIKGFLEEQLKDCEEVCKISVLAKMISTLTIEYQPAIPEPLAFWTNIALDGGETPIDLKCTSDCHVTIIPLRKVEATLRITYKPGLGNLVDTINSQCHSYPCDLPLSVKTSTPGEVTIANLMLGISPPIEIKNFAGMQSLQLDPGLFSDRYTIQQESDLKKTHINSVVIDGATKGIEGVVMEFESPVETQLTTDILSVDKSFPMSNARITLVKHGEVSHIYRCEGYQDGCEQWEQTGIPFDDLGSHVRFEVKGFSAYAGGSDELDISSSGGSMMLMEPGNCVPLPGSNNFYIDENNYCGYGCNDVWSGDLLQPWCTINKAFLTLQAGQTAYVLPGTYDIRDGPYEVINENPIPANQPGISPENSGTSVNPISIIGLTTAKDIIGQGNAEEEQDDVNQAFVVQGTLYIDKDFWHIEGLYFKERAGIYPINNDGFLLKDSLIFIDPAPVTDVIHVNGCHPIFLKNLNNAVIDHIEAWSIAFDKGEDLVINRCVGLGPSYETGPMKIINNDGCMNTVLRNSFLYGGKNIMTKSSYSSGCIVENNHLMHAQEHIHSFCHDNFVYRNNFFYRGQQAPYIVTGCEDGDYYSGIIENNFIMTKMYGQPYCGEPGGAWDNQYEHIKVRNNVIYIPNAAGGNACFDVGPNFNTYDSDYNFCTLYAMGDHSEQQENGYFWHWLASVNDGGVLSTWISGHAPEEPYHLDDFLQYQTDNQGVFDPVTNPDVFPIDYALDFHSLYKLTDDPQQIFVTPIDELINVENTNYNCQQTFSNSNYANCFSNCEPPFRIKLLADLHLAPGSPLIDAGDPSYTNYQGAAIDIGMYEYDGEQPPVVQTIPKYEVLRIDHPLTESVPANPFTAVTFTAEFTSPGGSRVLTVDGFFNGDGSGSQAGNMWSLNFAGDEVGTWTYVTSSNYPSLNGISGQVSVLASSNKGPIIVDPGHPHWFKYENGENIHLHGDFLDVQAGPSPLTFTHLYLSEIVDAQDRAEFIARAHEIQANKMNIYLANKGDYSGTHPTTPWCGSANSNVKDCFDISRWEMYEQEIQRLADEGIIAQLWFFADDSSFGSISDPNIDLFLQYGLARLSAYPNTMFIQALEWEEMYPGDWNRANNHGLFMDAHNPFDRLISIHGTTGDFDFPNEAWTDYSDIQSGNSIDYGGTYSRTLTNFNLPASAKPLINDEFGYTDPVDELRKRLWSAFVGGAAGTGTGSYIAEFDEFFTQLSPEFWLMQPVDAVLASAPSNTHCLARGTAYICYTPAGGTITLNAGQITESFDYYWFNPRTGTIGGQGTVGPGNLQVTPPYETALDWVLYLEQGSGGDTVPPVITAGPTAAPGFISAVISWTTDEPANTIVHYGLVPADYPDDFSTVSNSNHALSHSISLPGLIPETVYYYVVESIDPSDNSVTSGMFSFTTLESSQGMSIVGNPDFDPADLSPESRVWYDRMVASMIDTTAGTNALAGTNGVYEYGRTLNMHTTALLRALRATGDLQFLARAADIWKIAAAELDDSWCDGTNDGQDGYLNWVWGEGSPGDLYYCRDIHSMDETMAHGIVAALADALNKNRHLGAAYGYDFGAEADFWLDYLENHFLKKWYERAGSADAAWNTENSVNPPTGGFYKRLSHPRSNQLRLAYHLHEMTGNQFYADKFDEILTELKNLPEDNPEDTEAPVAYRWKHQVAGADEGWQRMTYARYVMDVALDMWAEGAYDDARMQQYMATFRDHVFTIPPHVNMYDRNYGTDMVLFNMYTFSGFSRWDPTSTLAGLAEDKYQVGNSGLYIAGGMLFALAEGVDSNCGNSIVEGIEQCDDGMNGDDSDQCYDDCTFTYCGDTIIQVPNGYNQVEECDDGNNQEGDGCDQICAIEAPDTIPPVITNIGSAPSMNTALVTWTTDELATSEVRYGIASGSYPNLETDDTLVIAHSVVLSGLIPETVYYFAVKSTDGSGNPSLQSSEHSFTTLPSGNEYTVSFQQGNGGAFSDTIDSYWEGGSAHGTAAELQFGTSNFQWGPIAFPDIIGPSIGEQIPAGATIIDAQLTLYKYTTGGTAQNFRVSMMTDPLSDGIWDEMVATSIVRHPTALWSDQGGDGDHDPYMSSMLTIPLGIIGYYRVDVAESVQEWAEGAPNHGWMVKALDGSYAFFRSSDFTSNIDNRPKLEVTYVMGASSECGDGVQDSGEECDDGANGDDTDQCYDDCTLTFCGDIIIQDPNGNGDNEQCDDGANSDDTDQCYDSCLFTYCGD
ncbi:MAG: fibronectin type III domain-containing protein, partial [Nanoarchaeota archaeon]